jgi:hypothetical protein
MTWRHAIAGVIPAKAGIHFFRRVKSAMDSRFRGNDVNKLAAAS